MITAIEDFFHHVISEENCFFVFVDIVKKKCKNIDFSRFLVKKGTIYKTKRNSGVSGLKIVNIVARQPELVFSDLSFKIT